MATQTSILSGAPPKTPELSALLWSAHSIIDANNRGETVDEKLIDRWISHLAAHKVTSVFWRGSYVGRATYHSAAVPVMTHSDRLVVDGKRFKGTGAVETLKEFNGLASAVKPFDTLDAALKAAKRHGMRFYADVSPFDKYFPGLEETFYEAHPDLWVWSRDQKQRLRGIPCYADPIARQRLLSEVKELVDRGVDGLSLGLLSHMGAFGESSPFGFNPQIVQLYKKRWGADILNEAYDPALLSRLNGEIFSDVLRDIRGVIGRDRRLSVSIVQGGFRDAGSAWGSDVTAKFIVFNSNYRIDLEWEQWLEKRVVDDISVMPISAEPSVEAVKRAVKAAAPKGKVSLMRKVRDPAMVPLVRKELAAIKDGALDGLVISEARIFEPAHTEWCGVFA